MHTTWAARFLRPTDLSGPRSFSAQCAFRPTRYLSAIAGGRCGWSAWRTCRCSSNFGCSTNDGMRIGSMDRYARITQAIQCPVYAVGGWTDAYKNAIPRLLERLTVPRKGLIGPWAHGYPHFALPGPQIGFLQEMLRWWDYWLKGIDTGVMDEPMLRAWMTESVKPASHHEALPGRWVAEPSWPPPGITPRRLFLTDAGLRNASGTFDGSRSVLAADRW